MGSTQNDKPIQPRYPIHGILILVVVSIAAVLFLALGGPKIWRDATTNSQFAPTTAPISRLGISAQQVDVYSAPDSKATVLATYRMGTFIEQVEILETQDPAGPDWYHIRFANNGARSEEWVNKYSVFPAQ